MLETLARPVVWHLPLATEELAAEYAAYQQAAGYAPGGKVRPWGARAFLQLLEGLYPVAIWGQWLAGPERKEDTMRQVLPICCFCDRVRDDTGTEQGEGFWQDFKSYLATYMLRRNDVLFSHTYCPQCLAYYRDFLSSPAGAAGWTETKGGA